MQINDKKYYLNITYKNMIKIFNLFSQLFPEKFKVNKALEILGFNEELEDTTKSYILDEIVKYILNTSQKSNEKKVFDYEYDFKYYYYDFLKLGINLIKDDISWWEFDAILEGLFLDSHCSIGQVIQYRTYEKPSKDIEDAQNKENNFYMEKKKQYALPEEPSEVENGLGKLWKYIEKKAGGKNE